MFKRALNQFGFYLLIVVSIERILVFRLLTNINYFLSGQRLPVGGRAALLDSSVVLHLFSLRSVIH